MAWHLSVLIFFAFFFCLQRVPMAWTAQVLHQITPPPPSAPKIQTETPAPHSIPDLMESIRFTNPVDFCGEIVPVEIPHVRKALEKEMLLMLWNRAQVILWLKRGAHYFPEMEKIFSQKGMPQDLKYVPVIESSLLPHARSSAGATGFWQFMKSTAQKYGLIVNSRIDQRRNIFDSTRAACAYIKALKTRFHSYSTAMAAYNMGENGLACQVKIQETSDYYSLYLNTETSRYVYRIIAAKLILENPEKYGFHLEASDLYPPLDFSTITIKASRRTPIMLVAKSAGVSFLSIKILNPHIRGYHFGPGKIRFLLPKGKEKGFKKKFAQMYNSWNKKTPATMTHVVKPGETLSGIAKKYRMSTKSLLRLNHMKISKTIHPGDRLKVK